MMRSISLATLLLCAICVNNVTSLSSSTGATTKSTKSKSPIFEYLKFDGNPQFDVLAKAQEYVKRQSNKEDVEDWCSPDYVLRGPVIGPITRKDLQDNQQGLGIVSAFPDITLDTFGFTIDPENPYRCFYFQRWRGTHTEDMSTFGQVYPATGTEMETPVSVFCVVFNPEGKVIYEQVGAVVDRLEGNTQGKAAVFGLLHTAGLKLSASPGDAVFSFIQKASHWFGSEKSGRSWSREEDIPKWWISPSRGAEDTEQW
eukprot:scaffold19424_cov142-Cylindrotheca_fusiformis.AAC.13